MTSLVKNIRFPKLARDSFLVVFSNGINFLTAGLWGVLLARWLGPEFFGQYGYWTGFFQIVSTIIQFGLPGMLTRELTVPHVNAKKLYFRFFISYHVSVSFIITGVLVLFLIFKVNNVESFVLGLSTLFIVFSGGITNTITAWFFAKGRAPLITFLAVIRSVLVITTGLLFKFLDIHVVYLLFIPAFYSIIRVIYIFRIIFKEAHFRIFDFIGINFTKHQLLKFWRFTWAFGLVAIIGSININSNPVILKFLGYTDYDYGIINAAYRINGIIGLTGGAILNVIMPWLSKGFFLSPKNFSVSFLKIFKPIYSFNILMISLLIIFSKYIILLLYGKDYEASVPFMLLFSVGALSALLPFFSSAIIAINKQKFNLYMSLVVYTVYPILKLIFIPKMGTIFIGWIEAIGPWVNAHVFIIFLAYHIKPKLDYRLFIYFEIIALCGIALPLYLVNSEVNVFLSASIVIIVNLLLARGLNFFKIKDILHRLQV
ncbi:MAG: oligosaccharide flippase family protein [Bacteroidales bacterium]|nr:oligosaccharide flippase family protein [Bacteroidales bacterium]